MTDKSNSGNMPPARVASERPSSKKPPETNIHWVFLKWSLMTVTLFWILVYHLSATLQKLPEFVYVNF